MRTIVIAALLALSLPAYARVVNLSWVLPTQFDDGSALNPATDLAEIRVYVDGTYLTSVAGNLTTASVDVPSGTRTFTVTAVATATGRGEGSESAPSNAVVRDVVAPRPRAPTLLDQIVMFFKRLFSLA